MVESITAIDTAASATMHITERRGGEGVHSATCAFIWQFNANKRARFDRVSSMVREYEREVQ